MNSPIKRIFSDPEFWLILLFNALFIYLYRVGQLNGSEIIWIYFLQSIFIGLQYFIRMIAISRRNPGPGRWGAPLFFLVHYGMFHMVYFIFLLVITVSSEGIGFNIKSMSTAFGLLAINTLFSTSSDIQSDKSENKMAASIMFIPYLRIFPMHLFIIIGFNSIGTKPTSLGWIWNLNAFLVFICLKTISDLVLHVLVNRTWKEKRPRTYGNLF